jgi:2-methylisocitrate lyase-like PEP mutase family enzyme
MKDLKSARQRFRSMHDQFFVIPNAWNVGEIRQLEKLGFGAVATTSAGLSASMGREDLSLSRDETLQNIRTLCAATDLPVNADFEAGFSDDAGVGANVAMAAEAGVCGLSIEDRKGGALYALPEAVARIKAARAALDKVDPNIVLVMARERITPVC